MNNNHTMDNVLLIDRCLNLHKKLYPLIGKMYLITDQNDDKPSTYKDFGYEQIIEVNTLTNNDIIDLAISIVKTKNIKHILSFDDKYQEIAGKIARMHGFWFPYDHGVCDSVRNKAVTRNILSIKGLDNLPYKIINDETEIDKFIEDYGYPLVMKPLSSQGSLAVNIIHDSRELKKAIQLFEKNAKNQIMLLEKYIIGKEYSFECFSENGNHELICVVEKFKSEVYCVGMGHRIPADLNSSDLFRMKKYVFSCLSGLGITNGPTHTELIFSPSGPVIVETHTRACGAHVPYLIEKLYNIDIQTLWIHQFLGSTIIDEIKKSKHSEKTGVVWFKHSNKAGVLDHIKGISETYSTFGVLKAEAIQAKFKILENFTKRSEDRLAYVIVVEDDHDEALNKAQTAINSLDVVYI
jgi:biotin carboxylase